MIDGMLLYGWSYANEPIHLFSGISIFHSPVEQEAQDLLEELKIMAKEQNFKLFKDKK